MESKESRVGTKEVGQGIGVIEWGKAADCGPCSQNGKTTWCGEERVNLVGWRNVQASRKGKVANSTQDDFIDASSLLDLSLKD